MIEKLQKIKQTFLKDLEVVADPEKLRVKYLGRKSELSLFLRNLKNITLEERRRIGETANRLRQEIAQSLSRQLGEKASRFSEYIDVTLPGVKAELGSLHPLTKVEQEIRNIFYRMGFAAAEGPEVETDFYNFEALNIPKGHPARDMHDTFYLEDFNMAKENDNALILRTHISPMQIRIMEKNTPPLKIISSGRVFRHEATDPRHEHTFDYMEGFAVGENVSLANLKYTLSAMLRRFFGDDVKTQFRPSYFPFVEPGLEVAVNCVFCGGKGCRSCGSGWLEILGAGMIHPNLFKTVGYPAGKYTGFAFGLGLSRFAMLKFNIPDIRSLYRNDLRCWKN